MDEFEEYRNSGIEIDVLGSDQPLSINYVVRLQTSEGKTYELTAADYYYEALELMLIYCDNEKNENWKLISERIQLSELIQFIDQFRNLIYSTLIEQKNDSKEYITNKSKSLNEFLKKIFKKNLPDFQEFADLLEKPTNGWNKDAEKRIKGPGCIAFAFRSKRKWYFSLSGSSVDYSGNILVGDNWSEKIVNAYGEVKKALSEFMKKYLGVANPIIKECHLRDNTRRYVLYGGLFLSSSVTLKNEVEAKNAIEGLKQHYSCCERKILTYIEKNGFVNPDYLKQSADNILKHCTFIIRYDPCEKCMPALFGCENIITGNGHRSIVRNFSCIDK